MLRSKQIGGWFEKKQKNKKTKKTKTQRRRRVLEGIVKIRKCLQGEKVPEVKAGRTVAWKGARENRPQL